MAFESYHAGPRLTVTLPQLSRHFEPVVRLAAAEPIGRSPPFPALPDEQPSAGRWRELPVL